MTGQRVFFDCGAAMTAATLTLNGNRLSEHVGGYLPFSCELTDHLSEGENQLAVQLDARFTVNTPPNRPSQKTTSVDFWQPGGLYRPAHLRIVPQIFLADLFAKPVNVLNENRRLEVECTLDAGLVPDGLVQVEAKLHEGKQTIDTATTTATLSEPGRQTLHLTLDELENIQLWDLDDPYLYEVVTTLSIDGKPIHDYSRHRDEQGVRWPDLQPPRTDIPYLVTEAVGTLSGPAKYYRRPLPALKQQGQAEAHAIVHNIAGSDERYCGLLAWSGYDYPSGTGNNYEGVKYTGVIDLFRVPKLGAAIYQAQVDPKDRPVIAPAFYWHFGPDALPFGKHKKAMICSNCERLELYVDGEHYTTVTPETERFTHLRYPPSFVSFGEINAAGNPELRIEGYANGQQLITRRFASDPAGDILSVAADDGELTADGSDATRVVFRAVDKFGAPRPYVSGEISLKLEGPATLVGNNPFAFEDTGGVGAIWVRTHPGRTGSIRLQASHPTLGSGSAEITALKPELKTHTYEEI